MKEKKKVKDERVQAFVIVVLVFLLVILVMGITFAIFSYNGVGETTNKITTGTMTMDYVEGETGISITNAMPMTEEAGKVLSKDNEMFDFTVSTKITGNQALIYEITAVKQADSTMENQDVRLYLQEGEAPDNYTKETLLPTAYTPLEEADSIGAKAGEMVLATVGATTTKTTYYRLRMWVDSSYNITDTAKTFSIKVNAYGTSATVEEANRLK